MNRNLAISISTAIFLIYSFALFHDSLNLPSFDDYDATLGFIKRFYFDNDSLYGKFEAIFARHNEHRIVFSKLISATYFTLFHQINFFHLVLIQNLFLLGFSATILYIFKKENQLNPTIFLIISAFLFSFSFWQVSFYYWGGVQHYPVFLFSFLTLIVLSRSTEIVSIGFALAVLLAFCALFSFGNGFLALLTGAFLLFAQKKYSILTSWLIVCAALLFITFFAQKPDYAPVHGTFNVEWMARLLFTFTGSFLYVNPASGQNVNIVICMLVGALILGYWIWLFFSGYAFRKPLLYMLLSLPLLSGIIISISRFETKAAGGIAPRYMFFTTTIPLILLLILLDQKIIKQKFLPYIAGLAVVIWITGFYNNYKTLQANNLEIEATIDQWCRDKNTRLVYYHEPKEYTSIFEWAIKNHVVSLPAVRKQ